MVSGTRETKHKPDGETLLAAYAKTETACEEMTT